MKLPDSAFPNGLNSYGRNHQIIDKITIRRNQLVVDYFQKNGVLFQRPIGTRNKTEITVNRNDCEWLSQTFFRNENVLYGFSLIEKSASSKMFLSPIKGQVDFDTFKPIGKNYAQDKNRSYYGPGGKIISEKSLELFSDETYKEVWYQAHPNLQNDIELKLWNSEIASCGEKIYWKGKLAAGVDSSLKRVTAMNFMDKTHVYEYNLQNIKKIEGVDINSLVYFNYLSPSNSIKSLICDKYQPLYCYLLGRKIESKFDFKTFKPLFNSKRTELNADYWWFKLEKELASKNKTD